jgi:hypothetical protein
MDLSYSYSPLVLRWFPPCTIPIRRTPIDDVWEPVEETFDGAFETVCRSSPHESYASIIAKATDDSIPLQPRLGLNGNGNQNESTRNSRSGVVAPKKYSMFGTRLAEGAHCCICPRLSDDPLRGGRSARSSGRGTRQ